METTLSDIFVGFFPKITLLLEQLQWFYNEEQVSLAFLRTPFLILVVRKQNQQSRQQGACFAPLIVAVFSSKLFVPQLSITEL